MLNDGNPQSRNQPKPFGWKGTGRVHNVVFAFSLVFAFVAATAQAQTSAFTFQGQLKENGTPANGNYDMQLRLLDAAEAGSGTQIGATINLSGVPVTNGVFTAQLDFGPNAFPGADRFLEVGVKPAGSGDPFNILNPRQPITATPYAIRSGSAVTADSATNANNATNANTAGDATHATNADNATNASNATNAAHATSADNATTAANATQLGGQPASSYVQTGDARLSDARPPTAGSTNYIQNTTAQEPANFNISGNGVLGAIGIGKAPDSGYKLDLAGTARINPLNNNLSGIVEFGTPSGETGMSITLPFFSRADLRFDGETLKLLVGPGSAPPASTSGIAINFEGNVGIGTTLPDTRLTLIGGPVWTSNGWRTSMNLQNAAALGWEANASGQRFGIGQTDGGLFFFRTNSAFGNTASPANYTMVITDAGDVTQPRDRGGLVKAMAYIDPHLPAAQYVVRAYNSEVAGNAITMTRLDVGYYVVNFGFDVHDRFISVTDTGGYIIAARPWYNDKNSVQIDILIPSGGNADDPFYVFVY